MQSLSMFSMGFHWQTGLLRATHPGTFHAFTTIKEKEKACLLLFLSPSPTPSKTLQHKTDPLNPHQLPARSILETLAKMQQGSRSQLTEDFAPGHEIPPQLHWTWGHLLLSKGTCLDEDAYVLEPSEHPTTPSLPPRHPPDTTPSPPPSSCPSLQSGHQ